MGAGPFALSFSFGALGLPDGPNSEILPAFPSAEVLMLDAESFGPIHDDDLDGARRMWAEVLFQSLQAAQRNPVDRAWLRTHDFELIAAFVGLDDPDLIRQQFPHLPPLVPLKGRRKPKDETAIAA
jgi:hypothetical protein